MNHKTIIRQYLSDVSDRLVCPKPLKVAFLGDMKENIRFFRSSGREITQEVLCKEFGSPEEIAAGFFNREDYEELLRKAKTRVIRWKIVSILVTFILLLTIIFTVSVIRDSAGTITVTNPYTVNTTTQEEHIR